jgi:broad-specificity NMP kinase
VSGAPGVGKSTLCYTHWADKSVTWDGLPPPSYWKPFLEELEVLADLIGDHPSLEAVHRMCARSIGKMATVERMAAPPDKPVFIQTGLMQRILGFGWRLHDLGRDVNLIRRAVHLMPVSVGVVFLEADLETLKARNRKREQDWREGKASHNENRSAQVSHMLPAIEIAKEALRERGIPVRCIDVQHQSIEAARAQLLDFAHSQPSHSEAMGHCG